MKYASVRCSDEVSHFDTDVFEDLLLTQLNQPGNHVDGYHDALDDAHTSGTDFPGFLVCLAFHTSGDSILWGLLEDRVDRENTRADGQAKVNGDTDGEGSDHRAAANEGADETEDSQDAEKGENGRVDVQSNLIHNIHWIVFYWRTRKSNEYEVRNRK